jgi:hypothetical protein
MFLNTENVWNCLKHIFHHLDISDKKNSISVTSNNIFGIILMVQKLLYKAPEKYNSMDLFHSENEANNRHGTL